MPNGTFLGRTPARRFSSDDDFDDGVDDDGSEVSPDMMGGARQDRQTEQVRAMIVVATATAMGKMGHLRMDVLCRVVLLLIRNDAKLRSR